MINVEIQTNENKEVIDITELLGKKLAEMEAKEGVLHLMATHTTCALSCADLDPGTDKDIMDALTNVLPDLNWRHPHNPAHAPDHILSTLVGTDVTIPVEEGKLVLGTWQRVVLLEFDGPRQRNVVLTFK